MPEEPGLPDVIAQQRELLSRLRAVVEAKDAENAVLRQELDAELELRRRLELRLAELERRLSMDSTDSGTPSSKERIGAKRARSARQQSERERSGDRKRGGQPGHQEKAWNRPVPAGTPPWTQRYWTSSASATTRPPPSGSSTTGCGTGTRGTTPATRWAAGCVTTRSRSSCSPATLTWTGRTTSPNAARKPRNATRPSPATGTPWTPLPDGAAYAATSIRPPPTASPHSTPSRSALSGKPWLPPLPAAPRWGGPG